MTTGRSIMLRRHLPARLTGIAGVLFAVTLLAAAPLQAATPTSYGVNLVRNGGAEHPQNHLASWDTFLAFKTHKYGASGFGLPSTHASQLIGGGTRFFYSGDYDSANSQCPEADQTITLKGIGSAIDSGHVKVFLSAYAGTSGASDIHAHVDLQFRTANNPEPVTGKDFHKQANSTSEQYKHITASKVLTPHTRTLRVHLYADGADTVSGCYAFWDKVSVIVKHV